MSDTDQTAITILCRVIEQQQEKIGELESKLEQREYNRRYANKPKTPAEYVKGLPVKDKKK